ncbi:SDR family oxidoreductase [Saccharopolyspora spinosa]|uniref:3-hydroxybutyrate dehydrogenase n=1 Tax=Saccharopolyspora spinosa TaxID=60894 RepID=A0A2N3Y0A9_SACSN|nr:SDR family oxidoreductase [Saccharopolyspora spinosa]PKW16354.1 3-hydroxybutyrate dehydrogenase [Saccharopolyspora spinosa]
MTALSPHEPADHTSLAGKVALVTGAAGALGVAVREEFACRGAHVVGVDRDGADCVHADISTEQGNAQALDTVLDAHGRLDIIVLNAGVQHMAPIPDFPVEEWERLIGVLLTGPFTLLKLAWPHLVSKPGGRVLVTASTSSFVAERFKAAYVAAKHGVLGLVKVAALEGADHGLTANAVAPSWMRTRLVEDQVAQRAELLGRSAEEVIADLVTEHAAKRFVEPREVAATLAFLASPAASAITGTCVPVDLGALA